jgi:hypothetical protein
MNAPEKDTALALFGGQYTIAELKNYAPDLSNVAGIQPYVLSEGPEKGVAAIDVWTGSGLEYTVLPDRGMNICNFRYRGVPLDWSSGLGPVSPWSYDPDHWGWLRSFNGGLMHTCGLNNVGEPCSAPGLFVDREPHGGHGRISNTPVSQLAWRVDTENAPYPLEVSGVCRCMAVQGENLRLERTIRSEIGGKRICVSDRICNRGFNRTPVFLLYHCNFGFPLLSEGSQLTLPAKRAVDRMGNEVAEFAALGPPSESTAETVVYPIAEGDPAIVELFNPALAHHGLGVRLKYRTSQLPCLTIWTFFQKRSYVMGIEPGTCRVEGRVAETEAGRAVMLAADEELRVELEFEIIEGQSMRSN